MTRDTPRIQPSPEGATASCACAAQGLASLTALIFAKAQPKRLGAQVISGPMLAGLASAYVDAINKGAVPTISTAWQAYNPVLSLSHANPWWSCHAGGEKALWSWTSVYSRAQ